MSKSTISTFQLFEMFPTPESARLYLESRLWPDGPFCPECKSRERIGKQPKVGFYRCNACSLDFTIRTGTIFERSHIPLHKWLYAMYLLVTARKGISSCNWRKEIGVTQRPHGSCFIGSARRAARLELLKALLSPIRKAKRPMTKTPPELDRIADKVLSYRPKPKTKAAKRRKRRDQYAKRRRSESSI